MKRTLVFPAMSLHVLVMIGCSDLGTTGPPPQAQLTVAERAIVSAGNDFSFRLFDSLNRSVPGQNLFISPLSVSMALGMTMNGANGATKSAMQETVGFTGMGQDDINRSYYNLSSLLTGLDPTVQMQIANSIWYRPTLAVLSGFKAVNSTYFNAEVNSVDFASPTASGIINGWVGRKTNGRITDVVPRVIPPRTEMYLINAIYFKGTWTCTFDPKVTKAGVFTLANGTTTSCQMMSRTDTVPYCELNGVQIADFAYGNGNFSMTVVLPPPGVDIDSFIAGLTQQGWNLWITGLSRTRVVIEMPKFKIEFSTSLKDVLSGMGMGVAFGPAADFSGIAKEGQLYVDDVIHTTFVQVDESGTEAAAVTVVIIVARVGPLSLRLDRPFLFAIREHQTGTILFMGKLAAP